LTLRFRLLQLSASDWLGSNELWTSQTPST
jgi:hypothetical protein